MQFKYVSQQNSSARKNRQNHITSCFQWVPMYCVLSYIIVYFIGGDKVSVWNWSLFHKSHLQEVITCGSQKAAVSQSTKDCCFQIPDTFFIVSTHHSELY